jgi:hypothetical protein
VPADWLSQLQPGDVFGLTDAGNRERALVVRGPGQCGVVAEFDRSQYVTSGLPLVWQRDEVVLGEGRVGVLPRQPRVLSVSVGDHVLLNASGDSDDPAQHVLAFPDPGLLAQIRVGERVALDDGKLVAVVEGARRDGLMCRVTQAIKSVTRLRSREEHCVPGQPSLAFRARSSGRDRARVRAPARGRCRASSSVITWSTLSS